MNAVPIRRLIPAGCLALLVFLAHPIQAQGLQSPASRLAVGESFPDRAFPSLDGTPRSLREFRGKKVILHVFASW